MISFILLLLPQNCQIEFVISLFGGIEEAQLKWSCDWEIGRRCAALEGLQSFLLLGLQANACLNRQHLDKSLSHIVQLTSRFRETLVRLVPIFCQLPVIQDPTRQQSFSSQTDEDERIEFQWKFIQFCFNKLAREVGGDVACLLSVTSFRSAEWCGMDSTTSW